MTIITNDESESMWKKAVVYYSMLLSQNDNGGTEKDRVWDLNLGPPGYDVTLRPLHNDISS
jgi:hypothetical protein